MTTLSKDTPRTQELGDHSDVGVIANDIVYEGAAVGDNGSGYGRPLVAGDKFLGFCRQRTDNTTSGPAAAAGSAGDLNVPLLSRGEVKLSLSGALITDVGRPVYASDDDTFTFTASGNSYIGTVKRFDSAGVVIVAFDAAKPGSNEPIAVAFTVAAQSGNVISVAGQVNYASGQAVAEARALMVYVTDQADGSAIGAPAGGTDVTIASGTDGLLIETLADVAGLVVSESDGDFDIDLTHVATGIDTVYLVAVLPDGALAVSGAITFA